MARLRDILLEGLIDARSRSPVQDRTYTAGKTLVVVDGGWSLR